MALTITIPGAVSTTTGSTAPAVLTVGVGAPGQGVPSGGSTGQYLVKASGVSYDTAWLTLPANYITSVTVPLAVTAGNLAVDLSAYLPLSGGTLDANATIDASTATVSSTFGGDVFGVQLSANPSENASLQYGGLQVQNAAGTMSVGPAGLTFPNSSVQTVAYPGSTGFLLKANNLSDLASASTARTNLGLGTMAVATAADYSTTTVANGLYYPLSGNPSAFLVAADIAGKANLASPSFTGNVSISSSTGAALFIEQTGTGNILTLHDQASDTTFVSIDANGKVSTIASDATNGAGFNIAHGVAPTSPVNGDIWTTTGGVFARINAGTTQLMNLGSTQTVSGSITFSNASQTLGSSTATGTINVASGATVSASTKTVNVATGGVSGSTTTTTIGPVLGASTTSIGNTTAASTLNLATGATLTATTKAVNIGTSGVAGSTTNIAIGSTTGTSTTTLQGTTNGITQTALDSSTALATTAFVTTADNLKANLASPTFTGTPTLPTGTIATTQSPGNNTTALATTAFVTAAVPAFASILNTSKATSTTTAQNPVSLLGITFSDKGVLVPMSSAFVTATSGAGSSASLYYGALLASTPITVAGYAGAYYATGTHYNGLTNRDIVDWTKTVGFSCVTNRESTAFPSGVLIRITLGKSASGGTLVTRGIGLEIISGQTYVKILTHDGTTLTTTNSTYPLATNLTANYVHQMSVISYGNGTAELFVDGVSYGTASGAPTTASTGTQNRYSIETYADGTQGATPLSQLFAHNKIITSL